MRLYCDNKSAINIAHNVVQHDKTKHIEIDGHFIQEKLEGGLICTPYVFCNDNWLTCLPKDRMVQHLRALYPSWEWKIPIYQLEGECETIVYNLGK